MPEPWLDVKNDIVEAGSVFRIVPVTLSGSFTISSFGTKIDFLQVTEESSEYSMQAPKSEFIKKELTSGVSLELPKLVSAIDAFTGYGKAANDLGIDQFTVKVLMSKSNFDAILSLKGKPVAGMLSLGFDTQGVHLGYKHIIGYIQNINESVKRDFMEVSLNIKAGVPFLIGSSTVAAYNSAMTTATIEPVGKSALTPKSLSPGDYSVLLSGVIVRTAAV